MNKYIFSLSVIIISIFASAQDKMQSVSLEFYGAHNALGVNYDSRLKGNKGWGYRVGVGFSYSSNLYPYLGFGWSF